MVKSTALALPSACGTYLQTSVLSSLKGKERYDKGSVRSRLPLGGDFSDEQEHVVHLLRAWAVVLGAARFESGFSFL